MTFVDKEHHVKLKCFCQVTVTQLMTGSFPNDEQLTLECLLADTVGGCNEQHFHVRRTRAGCQADIGAIVINRYIPPAQQCLTLFADDFLNRFFTRFSLSGNLWQEYDSSTVTAGLRQFHAHVFQGYALQKLDWQRCEHPCAVARILFAATGASVIHVPQNSIGIRDDGPAALPLDMGDETNTTIITLILGIVETMCRRCTEGCAESSGILISSDVFHRIFSCSVVPVVLPPGRHQIGCSQPSVRGAANIVPTLAEGLKWCIQTAVWCPIERRWPERPKRASDRLNVRTVESAHHLTSCRRRSDSRKAGRKDVPRTLPDFHPGSAEKIRAKQLDSILTEILKKPGLIRR